MFKCIKLCILNMCVVVSYTSIKLFDMEKEETELREEVRGGGKGEEEAGSLYKHYCQGP